MTSIERSVGTTSVATGSADEGYGDPDVVRMVPPAQYLSRYTFFTDRVKQMLIMGGTLLPNAANPRS